ncbi:protein tyrosine kinase [Ancylostoma caninum]|uniref:Protein tyrosine kinase n=1 Tax=Ancylostoma caninum TaxID=29170 RepID=A0A368GUT4_ANCCA|nr:protein tyrosine kinase [Ancylostoma caninum]
MKITPSTQAQLEQLHREARLIRVYHHRNIVKLHGLVFDDRDVMVVMELVSGGPLDLYLKNNKLAPLMKASFCYDIAAGLAYLHSKNCMHREVAARNCLVESDGKAIKLSDFGLAVHGRRVMLSSTNRMPARWQAPEVLNHYLYLRESDVWSYGMLMSEIYNDGKPPFHDKTSAEIRSKIHDPTFRPAVPNLPLYPDIPQVNTVI